MARASSPGGNIGVPLSPAATDQIILTDGGRRNGQWLTFPADAASAAAKAMHIHYATLVEPELAKMAFGPGGDEVWLSPLSTDLPAPPQKAP